MNREEFIEELRTALYGTMNQIKLNENIQYYEQYILTEIRKGRTEKEVLEELGSPRLIAKTLIDTSFSGLNDQRESYDTYGSQEDYDGQERPKKGLHAQVDEEGKVNLKYGVFKINSWYGKLIGILIGLLILMIVFRVMAFLIPIVLPIVAIIIVISLIRGSRR